MDVEQQQQMGQQARLSVMRFNTRSDAVGSVQYKEGHSPKNKTKQGCDIDLIRLSVAVFG